jgi:Rhodanese-like domain
VYYTIWYVLPVWAFVPFGMFHTFALQVGILPLFALHFWLNFEFDKHKPMKHIFTIIFIFCFFLLLSAGENPRKTATMKTKDSFENSSKPNFALSPIVDFDAYLSLAKEVQQYRKGRLISLDTFNKWSQQPGYVILDTRSDSAYKGKHIKGAIHLDFTNFTQESLAELIPDRNTKILIYCNNNFKELHFEPEFFVSKAARPFPTEKIVIPDSVSLKMGLPVKTLTLALNIPTFINLYGYGYRNVFELGEQVFVFDSRLKFEGTSIGQRP